MNVSVGKRWEKFLEEAVASGRYSSTSEIVREGLRLVEEREAQLEALRKTLNESIAQGGHRTPEQVAARLNKAAEKARARGR